MALVSEPRAATARGYRHEALLYAGDAEFVDATVPFIREGLDGGEPVMLAARSHKIDIVRQALDDDARHVEFVDIAEVGRNPARIIPAWRAFLDRRPHAWRVRGIGEPIWAGRTPHELVECQRHESLLNVAVGPEEPFWLICPYDVESLDDVVIDEALRSHASVSGHPHQTRVSARADDDAHAQAFLDAPLSPVPADAERIAVQPGGLGQLRQRVREVAGLAGLAADRVADLTLALSEAAANSLQHGGGAGEVALWVDQAAVVCQVSDRGRLDDPLVGRRAPSNGACSGRGLWLINQLCDLSQIRVLSTGTVVRMRMYR